MRELTFATAALMLFILSGCSSPGGSAALGALGGAAVGAGGYEYNFKNTERSY